MEMEESLLMKITLLAFMTVIFLEFSFSEQSCTPKRFYCGHQVPKLPQRVQNTTLWQCESDGKSLTFYSSCDSGCNAVQGGDSYCLCLQSKYYCGHELNEIGWKADENSLYYCFDEGLSTSIHLIEACSILCKAVPNRQPFCFRQCQDDQNYCGYMLKEIGWDGHENDTVYQCRGGNETRVWAKCSPGTCHTDSCKCKPGRYYCGNEYYEQMGWTSLVSRRMDLFKCGSNGTQAFYQYACEHCTSAELGARCECKTGSNYCGYTLQTMGWDGYDNDTLYLCERGQPDSHISKLVACGGGKCRDGYCECSRDKLYCDHELNKMGWRQLTSVRDQARLGRCTNGSNVAWTASCNNCSNTGTGSKCDCTSGIKYCGSKIYQMGYRGYNNDSIYLCEDTLSSLADTGQTNIFCSHDCIPGRSYCGYEIQYIHNIAKEDLQRRYICNDDKSLQFTAQCTNCINEGNGAYCQCIPGWRYCASTLLYTTGWKGFGETISLPRYFTNDTIFRCKDEENVEYVEICATNECKPIGSGSAHCLCSVNRTYCGHELYEHYNSRDTYLYPHYIYRCSRTRLSVIEQKQCGNCYRLAGVPTCRQECSIGEYYCGSDLLLLEGWQNSDAISNWLYRCDNSTTAQPIAECLAGCVSNSSEVRREDAYCAPSSTPWYLFFGMVAVPLVIAGLGFLLIRTILHHRRLKRLMKLIMKRIDVAQLTVSNRLGQGQFGEVWEGTYTNSEGNKRDVALKLSNGRIDAANCFLQEVMSLGILSHQNIIKVFGVCLNFKDQGGNSVPALVLEYMNGGSAITYMRSERNRLNGMDLLRIFQDICQAGDHLSKLGFIHRDIAARNVLVQNNPQTGHVTVAKLTDFGLAKDIGKLTSMHKDTNHNQTKLPFRYMAPEGFDRCFCFKSDVWSFGVFMWELYTIMEEEDVVADLRLMNARSGPTPYSQYKTFEEVFAEAHSDRKLKQPKMTPDQMYKIMLQCWAIKPESRPTFQELINSFNINGNGSIIEPRVTFLPTVSSDKTNRARRGKKNGQEINHEEKDKQHDQLVYASP